MTFGGQLGKEDGAESEDVARADVAQEGHHPDGEPLKKEAYSI